MNLYHIPSFHSASITPILQWTWEWCHLPLLQRLQLMLPHLVLIEQAVSRLFSICKCCGKGNCEKAAVGSREDCRQQGGPGMAAIFGPGVLIILPWTVRGDCPRCDRSTNLTQIKPGLHLPVSVDHLKLSILILWTLEPPF